MLDTGPLRPLILSSFLSFAARSFFYALLSATFLLVSASIGTRVSRTFLPHACGPSLLKSLSQSHFLPCLVVPRRFYSVCSEFFPFMRAPIFRSVRATNSKWSLHLPFSTAAVTKRALDDFPAFLPSRAMAGLFKTIVPKLFGHTPTWFSSSRLFGFVGAFPIICWNDSSR